jgi:hypothetical protein
MRKLFNIFIVLCFATQLMGFEVKQSTYSLKIPIRLRSSAGADVTGQTSSDIKVYYSKNGGSVTEDTTYTLLEPSGCVLGNGILSINSV